MHTQFVVAIVAIMLSSALISAVLETVEQADAQKSKTGSSNVTTAKMSNINTTKSMTNSTLSKAKNTTGPVVGAAGGSIGGAKTVSPSK